MANRFTLPLSQDLDGSGDPYAGGKLYFYETGTSTPLDTYSDSTLSTANANPVVADGNGRFGDIFMKTQDYKVVSKTTADVTIWTADPVSGTATATETKGSDIASATETDIGGSSGQYVEVTGAITITSFNTTDAGVRRIVWFMSANLTLAYNATSLILPGNANITTVAGDVGTFISLGSGNWVCVDYLRDDGKAIVSTTVDFARGFLSGLEMSNGTDSDHDIDFTAGECRGADDDEDITLAAFTKQIDATWAAGSAAGGLSSSLTAPVNTTWYHVHAIVVGGSADIGFDTSITAANLIADHSATAYRRIGSVLTDGSANIIAFIQHGDLFDWDVPVADVNANDPGATVVTVAFTVPTGLQIQARIYGWLRDTTPAQETHALFILLIFQLVHQRRAQCLMQLSIRNMVIIQRLCELIRLHKSSMI